MQRDRRAYTAIERGDSYGGGRAIELKTEAVSREEKKKEKITLVAGRDRWYILGCLFWLPTVALLSSMRPSTGALVVDASARTFPARHEGTTRTVTWERSVRRPILTNKGGSKTYRE